MAELLLENNERLQCSELISKKMAELGVQVKTWPVAESLKILLEKNSLNEDEKEEILTAHGGYFDELREQQGYQSQDLIVLCKETPRLEQLLDQFNKCHTHEDDEVRYIVNGEGVFGFVDRQGLQMKLKLEMGEYINIPKHTEHWFHLTESKKIKAIRYFTDKSGWVANYTGTETKM